MHAYTNLQLLDNDSVGIVSEDIFRCLVSPQIARLFRLHELTTRVLLLQHFKDFGHQLGRKTLETIVLPEVCLGVYDSNQVLSIASLSALVHLASLLGTALPMSHLMSLGGQLESRGFLVSSTPLPQSASVYNTLTVAPAKKAVTYWAGKHPWKRLTTAIFPDTAPKANRQAREQLPGDSAVPVSSGGGARKLCEVAALSATYKPPPPPPFNPLVNSQPSQK